MAEGGGTSGRASFLMKSAVFSMISVTLVTQAVNYMTDRQTPVPCNVGVNDHTWLEKRYDSLRFFDPRNTVHTSEYVPMRDGVELAVDTYIAQYLVDHNEQAPVILHVTRHGRGYDIDFPFSMGATYKNPQPFSNPRMVKYIETFISAGYVYITAEVRGSGVSGGKKEMEFGDQEVQDGYDLVEWITQQPWARGKVGVIGHGLDGVGALLVAGSGHKAIKALSLNGAPFDVYQSAFFPGGVANKKSINDFASFTHDTDRQIRWREIPMLKPRIMLEYFGGTVYPVDKNATKLNEHVRQHMDNIDLRKELQDVRFRDDVLSNGQTVETMDATNVLSQLASSDIAVYQFAGYYDMASTRSAILLHQYLTNSLDSDASQVLPAVPEDWNKNEKAQHHRLTMGPWSHAGVDNADPFAESKQKCFRHLNEISRFFDYHLYDNRKRIAGLDKELPIHYFEQVHHKWKETGVWPPSYLSPVRFPLGQSSRLESPSDEVNSGSVELTVSSKGTCKSTAAECVPNPEPNFVTRWSVTDHIFSNRPEYYVDRAGYSQFYLSFDTEEVSDLMEITGEALLRVFVSVDRPVPQNIKLRAVLEDVDYQPPFENERKRAGVTYITEAVQSLEHTPVAPGSGTYSYKKTDSRQIQGDVMYDTTLRFENVGYVLKRRHQLRLSIGIANDLTDFQSAFDNDETFKLRIHLGDGKQSSYLQVPMHDGLFTENVVPVEEDEKEEVVESPEPAPTQAPDDKDEL